MSRTGVNEKVLVCRRVSGRFSADPVGSSSLLWGTFPFVHSRRGTQEQGDFPSVELYQSYSSEKWSCYNFPFRCFYIKRNPSKSLNPRRNPSVNSQPPVIQCVFCNSLPIPKSLQFSSALITERPLCWMKRFLFFQAYIEKCITWSGQAGLSRLS